MQVMEKLDQKFVDAKLANEENKQKLFNEYSELRDSILRSFLRKPDLQSMTAIHMAKKERFIVDIINRLKKEMGKIYNIDPSFYKFINDHFRHLM